MSTKLNLSLFALEECPGYEEVIARYLESVERYMLKRGRPFGQKSVDALLEVFVSAIKSDKDPRAVIAAGTQKVLGIYFDLHNSKLEDAPYNAFIVLQSLGYKHLPAGEIPTRYKKTR